MGNLVGHPPTYQPSANVLTTPLPASSHKHNLGHTHITWTYSCLADMMLQGVKYIVIISTDVSYTCNASTQETISLVRPLANPPHPTSSPTLLVVNFHSWRRCLTTQTTLTSHSTPLDWQSRQWLVCTSPEP